MEFVIQRAVVRSDDTDHAGAYSGSDVQPFRQEAVDLFHLADGDLSVVLRRGQDIFQRLFVVEQHARLFHRLSGRGHIVPEQPFRIKKRIGIAFDP